MTLALPPSCATDCSDRLDSSSPRPTSTISCARHSSAWRPRPRSTLNPRCVLEYVAEDEGRAYAGLFWLNPVGSDTFVFHPRGLNRSAAYRVRFENEGATMDLSGARL